MLEKLEAIYERYKEVELLLSSPETMTDMKKFTQLNKEYVELMEIRDAYLEYKNITVNLKEARHMLSNEKDDELRDMAKDELETLLGQKELLEEKIKTILLPKDPQDSKNAILEIRSGTGGDEASIFAGDLLRMYQRYCANRNWGFDIVESQEGTAGGFSKVIVEITGNNAYGVLKFESGVHRVQRVPATESQGRVHTSAASVVVLPEAEEFDIDLKDSDIRVDTFQSSGPGGQSVNTTYSAVRLTHIPTGIVAQCQDEKSQIKNREKALKVLRSRIYEIEYKKYMDVVTSKRKTMVSTGDRSAKIRTYNYPQSRLTDHRIGLTLYNLPEVMNGDIQEIIDQLQFAENSEKMKAGGVE
jgi:peptide chain release factor 1